jgi:hypothetical protein
MAIPKYRSFDAVRKEVGVKQPINPVMDLLVVLWMDG